MRGIERFDFFLSGSSVRDAHMSGLLRLTSVIINVHIIWPHNCKLLRDLFACARGTIDH